MRAPIAITASLLLLSLVGGPKNAMCAAPRYIRNGLSIPGDKYVEQPYLLRTVNHNWRCVLTTSTGNEVNPVQHIVSLRSRDLGRAWIDSTPIEPPGVEASWAMPVKAFSGRIYVFYAWNGDDVRRLAGRAIRADMLGHYVFRY